MKTTCFNDGPAFVMVFEGITEEQKKILIQKFSAQVIGDIEAKNAPQALLDGPDNIPISEKVMTGGALKGFTIIGALREKGDYAFKILSHIAMNPQGITEEELAYIKQSLNYYITTRFNVPDEKFQAFATELEDAGCDDFIDTFDSIISSQMWQAFGYKRNEFASQSLENKRKAVYWVCNYWGKIVRKRNQPPAGE